MSTTNSSNGGIGVVGLLGVVFVTLKLLGIIDWSWWLVTLPFWGGFVLVVTIIVIGFPIFLLVKQHKKRAADAWRNRK